MANLPLSAILCKNGERSRKASLPCLAEALAKAERGDSRSSLKSLRLFFLATA
jgi:hypothetical protein